MFPQELDCIDEALVKFSGIYAYKSLCDIKLGASSSSHRKIFLGEDKNSKAEFGMSRDQDKIL